MLWLFSIVGAIAIGVLIATQLGSAMLDPLFFIPFACLSAFLAGQSVAESKSCQIGLAVLRSTSFMAAVLGVSLALLNLDPPRRLPDWQTTLAALVLSVSSAFLTAVCSWRILQRFSARVVKWLLRTGMLALYCLYRWMPGEWLAWVSDTASNIGVVLPSIVFACMFSLLGFAFLPRQSGPKSATLKEP